MSAVQIHAQQIFVRHELCLHIQTKYMRILPITDFFQRAGMDNTEVGSKGKQESQPADVAKEGIEALLAGKNHVYSAPVKTKVEELLANVMPGSAKGAMDEKMARPKTGTDS
jgi:hypothetical protein